jgi:hypothetical protein
MEITRLRVEIHERVYLEYSHSIISHWVLIWRDLGFVKVASLPATMLVGLAVLVATMSVSWRVFRSPENSSIAWAFLLWLSAMATFVSPIAQDYNLLFIPLVVLAVWSSDDVWWLQLILVAVLLWWQPFYIGLAGLPWLLLKSLSVALVGWMVMCRIKVAACDGAGVTASSPPPLSRRAGSVSFSSSRD